MTAGPELASEQQVLRRAGVIQRRYDRALRLPVASKRRRRAIEAARTDMRKCLEAASKIEGFNPSRIPAAVYAFVYSGGP